MPLLLPLLLLRRRRRRSIAQTESAEGAIVAQGLATIIPCLSNADGEVVIDMRLQKQLSASVSPRYLYNSLPGAARLRQISTIDPATHRLRQNRNIR